jgi:hypothetical protein
MIAFLDDAWKSLKSWFSSGPAVGWLVVSALLDVAFLFAYYFVTNPIKSKIFENLIIVGATISGQSASATTNAVQSGKSIIALLFQTPGIGSSLWQLAGLNLLLLVSGFALYCLFHGTCWWLARRQEHLHSASAWSEYVTRFSGISIWWVLFVIAYEVADLLLTLRTAVAGQGVTGGSGSIVLNVIAVILIVFAAWSYAFMFSGSRSFRRAFGAVVRHWRVTLPATCIVAIVFVAINYAIIGMSYAGPWLWLIAGLLMIIIALAWARLYLILSAQSITHVAHAHVDR